MKKEEYFKINTVFKRIFGNDLDMKSLQDRIRIQKIGYLLKVMGWPSLQKYRFYWWVRGPQSPDLTRDMIAGGTWN